MKRLLYAEDCLSSPPPSQEGRSGTGCTPPTQGEDSEVGDVAGDAAAGGKEVGGLGRLD